MFSMVGLDIICAAVAGAMVSSVILSRLGCTYSNFKSNPLRCSSKFLLSKRFSERNRNKEGLALENGNENYGGQTSTKKSYQRAGISTEKTMVSLLLLVATVAVSFTYQAGLNPPAGSREGDSYHERTSGALYTAAVLIAVTSCFIMVLHLVKIVISELFFIHYNSNARRHKMTFNGHAPVDREKSMGNHISESDPAAADEEDSSNHRKARESCWNVASAAVHHMTGSLRLLATGGYYSPMNSGEVCIVHDASTGKSLRVIGCGSVRTETMALDDVWYVPGLDSNLVSTGQLARLGCAITLGPRGCRITRGDALVGSARFVDGHRFEINFLNLPSSSK